MKKLLQFIAVVVVGLLTHPANGQNWQLVWQDEFNGGISPDWVFETGSGGWGNNELQFYRRENASVENGNLVITARREDFGGQRYTSARMKTQGKKSFRYGKIEARIALPSGSGFWPAFWMLGNDITSVGWPACGEIDIMEHINTEDKTYGTVHWQDNNGNYAQYGGNLPTNVNGFHTYTIEWNDQAIKWFFDGRQFHEVNIANGINGTSEFQNEFFLLLNLAIGGNWPGFNIDEGRLPAQMRVDYVRVYRNGGTPPPPPNNPNPVSIFREAEDYVAMQGVQVEGGTEGRNVGYIDQGDWMAYDNVVIPRTGDYTIEYRVASISGSQFSSDLNGGTILLGTVNVPATGGWQNWTTVRQAVRLNAGTYTFGTYARQGGWNLNWWKITNTGAAAARTAPKASLADRSASSLVYPNPVRDYLTLTSSAWQPGSQVSVHDLSGKLMLAKQPVSAVPIDVSTLPKGVFILTVDHQGQQTQHKFIKE